MNLFNRLALAAAMLFGAVMLSACEGGFAGPGGGTSGPAVGATEVPDASDAVAFAQAYRLGVGDKVRVIVYGEEDLSGEFEVDSTGVIALPLVGETPAQGKTLREFEQTVTAAFGDGYVRDPRVSVEVVNFRPFFILGEVTAPGEYPYKSGMNVLNAIAMAKGYTFRGSTSYVYITRDGSTEEVEYPADHTTKIFPGDIIKVPERIF